LVAEKGRKMGWERGCLGGVVQGWRVEVLVASAEDWSWQRGSEARAAFFSANILVARLYSSGAVVMYKIARSRPLASALRAVRVYRA